MRAQEEVGTASHLMLAQVGDDQLLAPQLMSAFDSRRQHRMTFCRIAADDQHKPGPGDIADRSGIAAVPDGPKQAYSGRSLAVPGAVVDVVGSDDGPRQLLHEVALFVRTLGRRDERQRVRTELRLDSGEATGDQLERFVPGGVSEIVSFAD